MNDQDSRTIMQALADLRMRQILHTKFHPETKDLYPDAYAYAVAHSLYPLFHEQIGSTDSPATILEINPFYATYRVDRDQVARIHAVLDTRAAAEQGVTFRELEAEFELGLGPWRDASLRVVLINACRYFYLHGLWEDAFWERLAADAPPEARGITRELDRFEVMPL